MPYFYVRRIGMTNPPVKLGVGKKFLEKRKEPPSGKMKLVWQPQHFNIGGSMSMNDVNDTLRMYKNDDIRMYNFNCITDTIVEVITTCNTYTLLTVHLL